MFTKKIYFQYKYLNILQVNILDLRTKNNPNFYM